MLISRRKQRILTIATYLVLAGFTFYCLMPFLWMFVTSIKPDDQIRTLNPSFLVKKMTFGHFDNVLNNSAFLTFFKNSLFIASVTTVAALLISIFAGYALSRFVRFKGVKLFGVAMMLSQMIPGVLLLIPLYLLMKNVSLINTYASLILAYTTFTVPLCTFMMKGFFDTIPYEMEESAEIDGCSRVGIIFRILLPVSLPSLVSTSLFAFLNAWNEFMFGFVFINDESHRTLTPGVSLFKGLYQTDWGSMMAASVLSVLPIVIIFVFLQRFLVEGMTAGAVKG
ncbi:multiple sugar transport system permease protein/raffinose/stachyose/melibiose transport system permease protein [Paenibacillus phyllosphaerae]|uniref:Multiple sugar transport system permease protein/raffinose/stachyose/melibiose transport system permease protein n=1 Tax=Paenibacillus phyllosphaerae TaxID=274593 RepID=A0A7W5B6C7_9BACL|nr:carbohydrate ABC transporter permease [Paenibacillus phyllosphaerae]MBB3114501.1 multiple sugar transport system permease protein/raffinose/stachyose/melibiose transport system permease protein [Paenibacillus phyllosphaerae]